MISFLLHASSVCQEESGETVNSESDGVAEWLCPLCQKGQTDRSSLSLHLTEQHSVLPSCVDRLLDIVSANGHYIPVDEHTCCWLMCSR